MSIYSTLLLTFCSQTSVTKPQIAYSHRSTTFKFQLNSISRAVSNNTVLFAPEGFFEFLIPASHSSLVGNCTMLTADINHTPYELRNGRFTSSLPVMEHDVIGTWKNRNGSRLNDSSRGVIWTEKMMYCWRCLSNRLLKIPLISHSCNASWINIIIENT